MKIVERIKNFVRDVKFIFNIRRWRCTPGKVSLFDYLRITRGISNRVVTLPTLDPSVDDVAGEVKKTLADYDAKFVDVVIFIR
jgi:hypothetical protein